MERDGKGKSRHLHTLLTINMEITGMKFKFLTAAVALAMAGSANAALVAPSTGNSSLVFTAWDSNNLAVGFARDLGLTFNDYRPGAGVLASGFSQTFLADPEFAATFGNNTSTVL